MEVASNGQYDNDDDIDENDDDDDDADTDNDDDDYDADDDDDDDGNGVPIERRDLRQSICQLVWGQNIRKCRTSVTA